ncbi:MAG: S8 family serine peptidase [candidate division KSB1 bacterium]|nr:S8 family serine peptidase [candidate division KSB1 bacterium]
MTIASFSNRTFPAERSTKKSKQITNKFFWRRLTPAVILGAMLNFATAAGQYSRAGDDPPTYFHDRVIVKFAAGQMSGPERAAFKAFSMPAPVGNLLAGFGAVETIQLFPPRPHRLQKKSTRIDLSTIYEIRFAQPINIPKLLRLLRRQPGIVYAEPVYIHQLCYVPNDPFLGTQSYLNNIQAQQAWDISRGDSSVVIAIVDTGVDWLHADLAANIWRNPGEIPNNGIDDDQNGFVDDIRGWDFGGLNGTPDNDPREDRPDHGTQVAGIAAAVGDNLTGIAGVAFTCKIMPVKVAQNDQRNPFGLPYILYGYQGIVYAAENGADVINCSWGSSGATLFEQEIIDYATALGALVVASAGNDNSSGLFYPAAYRNVLSAAATTSSDQRSSFSNFGYWVDVSAPGESIFSTQQSNTYTFGSGTSFSAPITAGIAALVKAVHKDWTPGAVAEQVRLASDNIDSRNPGYNRRLGYGRVNAQRAVTMQTPGVRLADYTIREVVGDGDGIFEPNEELAISMTLTNLLQTVNNLSVSLTVFSPFVSVVSGSKNVGTIQRGDTVAVAETLNFRIAGNAPANHIATCYVNFSAPGYEDWQGFLVVVRPLYGDILGGNVATTVTSYGAIGFEDYTNSITGGQIGRGFEFPIGAPSALFHGGLIIATTATRVSDVSYGNTTHNRQDFVTANGGELSIRPGQKATVEATARFNDSVAPSPIGVTVDQKVYAWAYAPWDDFVILEYTINNTTSQPITNLYAGFYLDWDIGESTQNHADWDNANHLGYQWANGSSYYGIAAVVPSAASAYRAVNNPDFVWPGFTDASKYQFMTGGFQVVRSTLPHDWSQLLSYGPYTLTAGQSITIAFAVLGGENLADLRTNARAAREAFLTVGVASRSEPVPLQFALSQNTPNPFMRHSTATTEIRYSIAAPSEVDLRLFNVLGQEIAVWAQGFHQRGNYTVRWNGRDQQGGLVVPGVYFYRLRANDFMLTRKLIVVQ